MKSSYFLKWWSENDEIAVLQNILGIGLVNVDKYTLRAPNEVDKVWGSACESLSGLEGLPRSPDGKEEM